MLLSIKSSIDFTRKLEGTLYSIFVWRRFKPIPWLLALTDTSYKALLIYKCN